MEYTENLRLKKPGQTDFYDVEDFNGNMDILDMELDAHAADKGVHIKQEERVFWNETYAQAILYTDKSISDLINGAPSTLDTLKEIADAISENESVVEALDAAIGSKAGQDELDSHTRNGMIHVTASERTKWNEKQDVITGAASTIVSANLTKGRALVSNENGKVSASAVTGTELGCLGGTRSNVQTQIDLLSAALDSLLIRQSFISVPIVVNADNLASVLLKNKEGQVIGPANNPHQSFIIFCQYRGAEGSPDGSSIWSVKFAERIENGAGEKVGIAKAELLAAVGETYPVIGLSTPSKNVYVKRSGGTEPCAVDVSALRTR